MTFILYQSVSNNSRVKIHVVEPFFQHCIADLYPKTEQNRYGHSLKLTQHEYFYLLSVRSFLTHTTKLSSILHNWLTRIDRIKHVVVSIILLLQVHNLFDVQAFLAQVQWQITAWLSNFSIKSYTGWGDLPKQGDSEQSGIHSTRCWQFVHPHSQVHTADWSSATGMVQGRMLQGMHTYNHDCIHLADLQWSH